MFYPKYQYTIENETYFYPKYLYNKIENKTYFYPKYQYEIKNETYFLH